jgi:hypothetical protein
VSGPDPFSPAGRFEERRRDAEQQRALEAKARKAMTPSTPQPDEFEVWSEGYAITGNSSGATFEGKFKGATFRDACAEWAKTVEEPHLYNAKDNTYWGCRLFDNETDARRSFG